MRHSAIRNRGDGISCAVPSVFVYSCLPYHLLVYLVVLSNKHRFLQKNKRGCSRRPSISYAALSILSTSGCSFVALLVTCSPFLDTVSRFLRNQQSSIFSCNSLEVFPSRRPYTFFEAFWNILRACSCYAQFASLPCCWRDNILSPAPDRMLSTPLLRSMDNISAAQTHRQTPSHILRISLYFLQGLCSSPSFGFL